MAYLDPKEAFEHLQTRVLEGIRAQFPIQGKQQSLHLEGLEVKDELHPDDIKGQQEAKVSGKTWSVPVYANLVLKDNAGKVIDRRRWRVAEIPKTTSRYSYIVGGQEYQVDNQWQLKPGVYVRRDASGELESHFNVTGKGARAFDVVLDPATKIFSMQYGKSRAHIPLYPLLKTLGVPDQDLERSWGKEILQANQTVRKVDSALEAFYKVNKKTAPPDRETAAQHFYDTMAASTLRPEATQVTIGKPFSSVSGETLKLATEKMLKVQAGHPEDDRDSLVFKDLRTTGDFAFDKLRNAGRTIKQKAERKINQAKDIRDIVKFDHFNEPLKETFTKNPASRTATQINPLEMVSSALQTTIMGVGGIKSERSVTDEAKFVNPSHLGFLDPIHTPEGEKTGITLRLPIGIKKVGNEARIPLFNLKTGRIEDVSAPEFMRANVVLPDQVRWENGKPHPLGATVRMSGSDNQIRDGHFKDAQYVMRHASQLFNMTSNLIPFLGNTSGNRASMASRQMEQAISLVHREAPLVQVGTGSTLKGADTFENLMGRQTAHVAPVDGKVVALTPDHITIQDHAGEKHQVSLYNNYPLNDAKGVMHSTPHVEVGSSVKKGEVIADTNFSKKGTLALGTNLRVAYVPFKGYNFEDGIVISQSAADKLASEHLHKPNLDVDKDMVLDKHKFHMQQPGAFSVAQLGKLDDRGVIRVGQKVKPGDPLIAAMKPYNIKDRTGLDAIRRGMSGAHTDKSLRWDSEFDGEVVGVHEGKNGLSVHVRTVEPMQIGDKMAGRYGNKGIVTMILPDQEMPHTKDGKHIEVALNPSGVPGRMNVGQVLETAASKIALKTGKPYIVKNFEPNTDFLKKVQADMKAHGLSDTEELHDPVTKQPLGPALVGQQHLLKLVHQVEKKLSVRSGTSTVGGAVERYDQNLQPTKGGGTGGQTIGTLGLYALLAHGAKANIREMQTYKSEGPDPQTNPAKQWPSDHNRLWAAIQTGGAFPTPKPTFAFQKFTDMLRGAGINVEKDGHNHAFILTPLTDDHIKSLAKKELPKPAEVLQAKLDKNGDPKPKPGGLFDEHLTGGHGGRQWTRIGLAEPLPNPVFEGPIRSLTGLKQKDFDGIIGGSIGVTANGRLTQPSAGVTGGAGIKILLDGINVKRDLPIAENELRDAKGQQHVDNALKKVKYLRALDQLQMTPSQAYILHNLPVVPPVMRPVSKMPSGSLRFADLNQLYSDFAKVNEKLKDPVLSKNLTDEGKKKLREDFYDGAKAITGIGKSYELADHKGLLHEIMGSSPKRGYFQDVLVNRRQDLTMRSTIVPEPKLGLDEVGLPKNAALDLFRPFVIRKLKEMGAIQNELQGPAAITKQGPQVWRALDKVMAERPVLLKRDPALHKYSVQAFRARASEGNAIQIHPLVTGGFNADFDGDTMSVFVPITREAVAEAHNMFPSRNLFSEASGKVMYQPTLESALGLYKLSDVRHKTDRAFTSTDAVIEAAKKGSVHINDIVRLPSGQTTPGRVLLSNALPEPMRPKFLHDLDYRINKSGLSSMLHQLAKDHSPQFGEVVNKLKDLGNTTSFGAIEVPKATAAGHPFDFKSFDKTPVAVHNNAATTFIPIGTHTLSLKDFEPDLQTRNHVLGHAEKTVAGIYGNNKLTQAEKDRQAISVYKQAEKEMKALHEKKLDKNPTNLFTMYRAGVKPDWTAYKQMVIAPMIYKDSADREIPTPVTKSYAEGLDVGSYWTQMHGARRGSVLKVQEVREPGYMSKLLMNNMMHMLVTSPDCGTTKGISLEAHEPDVHDRYLQQDFTHGKMHIPAGTMLTPDVVGKIRAAKKDALLVVRSPMKCEEEKGVCQKCMGIGAEGKHYDIGTNIGVQSAHAVGERAVQLTLKSFHTGGADTGGSKVLNSFSRFQQLMELPKHIPDEASLAMVSGKVEKIQPTATGVDIFINGRKHHVGRDRSGAALHIPAPGVPLEEPWKIPSLGTTVRAGDPLSDPNRTYVNPHHLYAATGSMEEVQNHLAREVNELYKGENVKRRAVETVVRAMGNLTEIIHPGDHETVLRGEYRPLSSVQRMNQELTKQGLQPIEHRPVLKGVTVLPHEIHEDWMAKLQHDNLRATLLDAAATRGISHIHGNHPIPGVAFGAEFGLTEKDSLKPGLGHLKNVPGHSY